MDRSAQPPIDPGARSRAGAGTRKLIHVAASLVAVAVVWSLDYPAGAVVLAAATSVALAVELARRAAPRFGLAFQRVFGTMLTVRETERLTGATTLAVGFTVAATLFPGWPAIAGMLVAGVADPVAALAGRRFGRRRYRGGKSVEGSAAFFLVAFLLLCALPSIGTAAAILLAAALTVVEAPTLRYDDNLYLPGLGALLVALVSGTPALGGFA